MAITEESVAASERRRDPMEELTRQFKDARSLLDDLPGERLQPGRMSDLRNPLSTTFLRNHRYPKASPRDNFSAFRAEKIAIVRV